MTHHLRRWGILLGLVTCLWVGACGGTPQETAVSETPEAVSTPVAASTPASAPEGEAVAAGLPALEGTATVALEVNGDRILIDVDGEHAPVTAGNFVDLVQRGVYDNLVFHRVIREPEPFVAQGGDPQSADPSVPPQRLGTGSFIDPDTNEPRLIPLEIQPQGAAEPLYGQTFEMAGVTEPPILPHTRGAVAMARSQVPNSASSQFYIALTDLPFLDGSYAVFGYVTEGLEAVDNIQQGDVITSATVVSGADNLQVPE
jgi:peptidyl-prolyl cis-trans isomerase B (cyclophilin B)